MSLSNSDTLDEIKRVVREYAWDQQPMYQALMDGDLTMPQLREFTRHYGVFALHNHNYHGRLYVNCPDPLWRRKIAEGGVYLDDDERVTDPALAVTPAELDGRLLRLGRRSWIKIRAPEREG